MKRGFMILLSSGLFILLIVLFVLSCTLSRRQHLANLQSIRADYLEILNREISSMRERIQAREVQVFGLFDSPDLPFDLYRANRLFLTVNGKFFPAGLPDVLPVNALDKQTAQKAFQLGHEMLKAGRDDKAREYLETAVRISAEEPEELEIRISACLELLRKSGHRDQRTIFSALYAMFDYPGVKPTEEKLNEYEKVLRENIPRYDSLKEQSREIWKTAAGISDITTNRPAPFRALYNNDILFVNVKGFAFLTPINEINKAASNSIMRISASAPGRDAVVSRQLHYPPVHAWIPATEFTARKQSAERAYFLTNIMLGVLLTAIAGMGLGIGIVLKREHEVTSLKSSFVSAVSHELRTPMSLIRLYAESLSDTNAPPGSRERYTRAIMSETDRLSALINNVLDFSMIERGTIKLNMQETDVSQLCLRVLESFNFRLEKEKINLSRKITGNLAANIDPLAMTQVIFNLVDNAVKYSGENGGIEVEMTTTDEKIFLKVKDNGIGIPDSLKPRIFEPFTRGSDNRVTAQRGSGIGLSVVRELLERMQCSVTFFDNVPAGTVFEVTIPASRKFKIGQN